MATTKENCYQGLDRSVLIELKKIYQSLDAKSKERRLSEVEFRAYSSLHELFSETLHRPFLQGDNSFTFENEMDRYAFINALRTTLDYVKIVTKSTTDFVRNRLQLIDDMDEKVVEEHAEYEFSDGKALDISQMSEEDYKRAAKEFAEGSKALEEFLLFTYKQKMYTKACCAGHDCKNGSKTMPYIAFDFGEFDEQKMYLISKAFEKGMEIAFIEFDTGLGFDIIPNPYEIEEQISYLTHCLENYRGNEKVNPILMKIMEYMRHIESENDRPNAFLEVFKAEEKVGIVESSPMNLSMRGVFEAGTVLKAYEQKDSTKLRTYIGIPEEKAKVNSRDTAKSALELTKQKPGKFGEAMRRTLDLFRRITKTNSKDKTMDLK